MQGWAILALRFALVYIITLHLALSSAPPGLPPKRVAGSSQRVRFRGTHCSKLVISPLLYSLSL